MPILRIGYVMPVKGHVEYARAAIESLVAGSDGAILTVYVVEDGKTPSPDWLPQVGYPHSVDYVALGDDLGPTAAWNHGLSRAIVRNDFVVMGNDDVLAPKGWWKDLFYACDTRVLDFVGPLSNSPGTTNGQQHVTHYLPDYTLQDDVGAIDQVQGRLQADHHHKFRVGAANGFFIAALSKRWRAVAYDAERGQIFPAEIHRMPSGRVNPTPLVTGQEDWLHQHARMLDFRMGISPGTFVFHYRSVTRGTRYCVDGQLWCRRETA